MSDVSISIEARDRVSQTMDEITRSVAALNGALEEMESHPGPDVLKGKMKDVGHAWSVMGSGMKAVGTKMTNYITKPAIAAATGLAGLTLAKGFSRMKEIDEARVKIRAMGQDFDSIKEAALNVTKGTAYGLNEALTAGASAAAAGVGKNDMQKYLGAVADTAAVAGVSFTEMGSVFNKVMANGKMSAEEWNMLTDRSVDVFGIMRKATGKTNEELIEMRKNGEITADMFMDAFANAYETVDGQTLAQRIGSSTISGSLANINAALARIGANFLGDTEDASTFAGKLLDLMKSVQNALGKAEEKAGDLGKAFGDFAGPYMDKLTTFFNGIGEGTVQIDTAKAKMGAMAGVAVTALGPALKIVGGAFSIIGEHGGIKATAAAFGKIAPQVMRIAGPIGLIITGLIGMWQNSENFRNSVTSLFSSLWQSLQTVATALAPVFQSLMDILGPVMGAIGDMMAPLVDMMASYIAGMAQKIAAVAEFISPAIAKIAGSVGTAAAKIRAMGGAWKAIRSGTKKLLTKVSENAKAILDAIKKAWDAIVSATKKYTVKVLGGAASILGGIKGAWDAIQSGTKTLKTRIVTIRESRGGGSTGRGGKGGRGKGGTGHHATGTKSAEGGWTLVGERGPEMVDLPKGASVHTARDTAKMLGGNNIIVNMTNNLAQEGKSVSQIVDELVRELQERASASAEGVA